MLAPSVCGVAPLMELSDPWITVRVNGVVEPVALTVSVRPVGLEANESFTVLGSRRIVRVSVSPPLSVTVSRSSMYDGYSWSGAGNDP